MSGKHNMDCNSELDGIFFLNTDNREQVSDDIESNAEEKPWKKVNLFLVFGGLQLALFLSALDHSIVAPILPRIGSEFNQMKSVSWVGTAYLLSFVVFLPLFAKFSDIFGRKLVLMIGIVTFLVGSLLSGVSNSLIMLIISRVISGIGGGGISGMVYIIIADLVPLEKRGNYQGIASSVFALACILGPLIGGSLSDYVNWRWSFYINIPIGTVAIVDLFVFLRLPAPKGNFKEKIKRIDYLGALLVLVSGTLFLLAINFGGALYPWKSAAVIVPLVLAIILLFIFIHVETKVEEPLMPPHLFKNVSLVSVLAANWFFGMCIFSFIYYLPIYFQAIHGDSAMWSGFRLIPMLLIMEVLASLVGVFISNTGIYMPLLPLGMAFLSISIGLLSLFNEDTLFSVIYGITVISGVGMAFMYACPSIAIQASVDPKDTAVALGLGDFTRILGGASGIAICSAILNSSLAKELPKHVPADIVHNILDSLEYIRHGCPPKYFEAVLACYIAAFHMIWYILAVMSIFGFFCSLNVRNARISKAKQVTYGQADTIFSTDFDSNLHDINRDDVAVNIQVPIYGTIDSYCTDNLNKRNS